LSIPAAAALISIWRRDSGSPLQASAIPSLIGRGEWETEIESSTPDFDKSEGTPLERLASKTLRRKLKPVFKTSVHRVSLPVRTERSEIELAVDRGRLIAGRRSSPIQELELELKKGRLDDLFRLAKSVIFVDAL
jgi:inorganic triphosphatase YgiF